MAAARHRKKRSRAGTITRRALLVGAVAVGGGVAFGYYAWKKPVSNPLKDDLGDGEATFNPYVKIASDNTITIIAPRAEMGQGIETTLAALVAEELDVDLDEVQVEHGPTSSAYANIGFLEDGMPFAQFNHSLVAEGSRDALRIVAKLLGQQLTGGSTSTIDAFDRMRRAGASARETLKRAAADQLGVSPAALSTSGGVITHEATGRTLTYGDVAEAAARRNVVEAEPKPASEWRLLGKSQPRTDMRAKVAGHPIFGIDTALPGMVFATVRMNPALGGSMRGMDSAAAQAINGVEKIVPLESRLGSGYAVIAKSTWHAFKGADAVVPDWGEPAGPVDDAAIWQMLEDAAAESGSAYLDEGDVAESIADAPAENLSRRNIACRGWRMPAWSR